MITIYLIRHGVTLFNEQRRYISYTDQALTELGKQQAEALAKRLSSTNFDQIYVSPRLRARETAGAINLHHDQDLNIINDFDEVNFGDLEGLSFEEIAERFPDYWSGWTNDPSSISPPGGETWAEFKDRVGSAISKIIAASKEGDTIMVVAHGGVIRAILVALDVIRSDQFHKFSIMHTSITKIITDGEYTTLDLLNDQCHLEGETSLKMK